ncbi:hypothetical protein [Mycolicibacterium sp. XJ870]
MVGAVAAVGWAPLAAAIVAAVYRFPVPFGEYASGLGGMPTAALASVFYLALGGFLVLGALGAVAGALLAGTASATRLTVAASIVIALLGALTLALLEYVIGPW